MERSSRATQQPKAAKIEGRGPHHDCGASPPPTNVRGGVSRLGMQAGTGSPPKAGAAKKKSAKRRTTKAKSRSRSR